MAAKQNNFFENSLATYDRGCPDRLHNISNAKTLVQVKNNYEILLLGDMTSHSWSRAKFRFLIAEATDGAMKKPIVAGNNVGNLQSYLSISRQSNALSLVLSPAASF